MKQNNIRGLFVRMKGLEPPYLAALDPKSSASTNFATSAIRTANLNKIFFQPIYLGYKY